MKRLLILLVVVGVGVFAWRSFRNNAPEPAPKATYQPGISAPRGIPQAEATPGSSFNKAFPAASGEFHITFTQEKDGFAQAELSRSGARVAAFTISDTDANPSARDKFTASVQKMSGYPAAPVGTQGTAILVANRYQVQVRSLAPGFTAADRASWLEKFNLPTLSSGKK